MGKKYKDFFFPAKENLYAFPTGSYYSFLCNFVVQNSGWAVAGVLSVTILKGVGCSGNNVTTFFFNCHFMTDTPLLQKMQRVEL